LEERDFDSTSTLLSVLGGVIHLKASSVVYTKSITVLDIRDYSFFE